MISTRSLIPALAALAALGAASIAHAQNIPVQNFSFEAPTVPTNTGYTTNVITGWNGGGEQGFSTGDFGEQSLAAGPSLFPNGIPDGAQYAYVNAGFIYQDTGTVLTAGTTYTLTAYVGERTDQPNAAGSLNLDSFLGGLPTAVLATSGSVTSASGTFTKYTTTFTASSAQAGQDLGIVLSNTNSPQQVNFDNVNLTQTSAPVPETSTTVSLGLLLALGLGGAMLSARKKSAVKQDC